LRSRAERNPTSAKQLLVSLVILGCLGLQTVALLDGLFPFLNEGQEFLWPFLDYPMYHPVHHEGEVIEQYVLVGTFADSTEVMIPPEAFGLNFWKFRSGPAAAMRHQDSERIELYLDMMKSPRRQDLARLRLEDHPVISRRSGPVRVPPVVVSELHLDGAEPVWGPAK
jgi:hypothetical protein